MRTWLTVPDKGDRLSLRAWVGAQDGRPWSAWFWRRHRLKVGRWLISFKFGHYRWGWHRNGDLTSAGTPLLTAWWLRQFVSWDHPKADPAGDVAKTMNAIRDGRL